MSIADIIQLNKPLLEASTEITFDGEEMPTVRAVMIEDGKINLCITATETPTLDFTGKVMAVKMGRVTTSYVIGDLMDVEVCVDLDHSEDNSQEYSLIHDYTFDGLSHSENT